MTTLTIDIPDEQKAEVIAQLEKLGVMVRESKLEWLDQLTKQDYQKHFEHQAKATRNNVQKYL